MRLRKILSLMLAAVMCVMCMSFGTSAATEKKSVTLKWHKTYMYVGETLDLEPTVKGFSKYTLTLTTENKNIATISKEGVVTALKEGEVKIKAAVKGTKYGAQCTIIVQPKKGSSTSTVSGPTIPDPGAFFGCEATDSGSINSKKGSGYYLSYRFDLDTNKKGIDEYKQLLSDKYNFKFCSSGMEDFSSEGSTYTSRGLIYGGKEKVSDILLYLSGNYADAFIMVNYYNGSGQIGLSVYYSSDITVSDLGDRASYVTSDNGNSNNGNSNSNSSGKGNSSSGSSSNSSWKKGNGVTVKCVKCHGSGKITCTRCYGHGTISSSSSSSPNNSGKRNGSKTGRVKSLCSKCKGSGKITCTRCKGDGKE